MTVRRVTRHGSHRLSLQGQGGEQQHGEQAADLEVHSFADSLSGHKFPKHIWQDPAVLVVIHLDRGVDTAEHRHFAA